MPPILRHAVYYEQPYLFSLRNDFTHPAPARFDLAWSYRARMSPFRVSTSTPILRAFSPQPTANLPLSNTRILSPFDSTLVSEASQAPCRFET
jgi:hypothetical protein